MAISVNNNKAITGKVDLPVDQTNAIIAQRQDLGNGIWVINVVPDGWRLSDYQPGQYTTLGIPGTVPRCEGVLPEIPLKKPEKLIKRAYSIVSSPQEKGHLEFYLVLIENGTLTPRLFTLFPGDRLWMSPKITGSFVLSRAPEDVNLVLVATGTGIAPYVSMLRTVLRPDTKRRIALLHGVRESCDLGYMSELLAMERVSPNFTYIPTVSRTGNEIVPWTGRKGYVQQIWESRVLDQTWGVEPTPENTHVFLCGSPAMIESMIDHLGRDGFTEHTRAHPGQIHVERYW
ncbi:MAG: ferredoxin--NADP reductase [Candidatus Latescibacterota bacterium]|nr:MAG: ferredoxin--NADP reductase [Candidatus Latescibacterota bacterium]